MQAVSREMADSQKSMQIEMAMKQRQAQMAMQIAINKERFKYISGFVGILYLVLPVAAFKTRNVQLIFPLAPFSLLWAFNFDMLYGTLLVRA